jgi:hypothetical protein
MASPALAAKFSDLDGHDVLLCAAVAGPDSVAQRAERIEHATESPDHVFAANVRTAAERDLYQAAG